MAGHVGCISAPLILSIYLCLDANLQNNYVFGRRPKVYLLHQKVKYKTKANVMLFRRGDEEQSCYIIHNITFRFHFGRKSLEPKPSCSRWNQLALHVLLLLAVSGLSVLLILRTAVRVNAASTLTLSVRGKTNFTRHSRYV